jgi:hypothetical protein
MVRVLAGAMVPVARGLVRASWARQCWTVFRYSDERFDDMALLLLLTMD